MMTSIAGMLLSLALLIVLPYRGVSLLVLAPLAALANPEAPVLSSYTQVFMKALGASSCCISRCSERGSHGARAERARPARATARTATARHA
jgi:hypothetical protein